MEARVLLIAGLELMNAQLGDERCSVAVGGQVFVELLLGHLIDEVEVVLALHIVQDGDVHGLKLVVVPHLLELIVHVLLRKVVFDDHGLHVFTGH